MNSISNKIFLKRKIALALVSVIFCDTGSGHSSSSSSSSSEQDIIPISRFESADRGYSIIRVLNCNYTPRDGFSRPPVIQGHYSSWLTYLSPYGFTDDSSASTLIEHVSQKIIDEKVQELKSECEIKLRNTDMKLFKIATGDSNTNPTFNISVNLKEDGAGFVGPKKIVNGKQYPNSYKKEIVVDIHFNYPNERFEINQDTFKKYFNICKHLIKNRLDIPDCFEDISKNPQKYGLIPLG